MEQIISAVGVLDKAMAILAAVERSPQPLLQLIEATGFSRATTHRLAGSLEEHGLLRRTNDGHYALGFRTLSLARATEQSFPLADTAQPALEALARMTGESVQLYVRDGENRVCVAAVESSHGLRTIVERGAVLPLSAGSGALALAATPPSTSTSPAVADGQTWFESVAQREPGVASVSAPVCIDGEVVAAVSVSGPIERLTSSPGQLHGAAVAAAAAAIATATNS